MQLLYFPKLRNPIKFELHWNSKVESYYYQKFSAIGNFLYLQLTVNNYSGSQAW